MAQTRSRRPKKDDDQPGKKYIVEETVNKAERITNSNVVNAQCKKIRGSRGRCNAFAGLTF